MTNQREIKMLNLDNVPQNGQKVVYQHRGASFNMTVTGSRVRYGQIDVQLTPLEGIGSFWVRADSVGLGQPTATQTIASL
jgi:hypothetical protein